MLLRIERSPDQRAGLRRLIDDFGATYFSNGLIAFIFTATGPLAIILSVGTQGGLSKAELASWVFGVFCINGVLSIIMSWRHKMPLGFAYTIPGTVLVGPALQHLSFPEVIGAFYVTSLITLAMGASGLVKRLMSSLPMPIVMGMVAGVFLRFGLDLVRSLQSDAAIAAPMIIAFIALSASSALGKRIQPIIGALIVGVIAIAVLGRVDPSLLDGLAFAKPVVQAPAWSLAAMIELVVPLTITVLVVQNGQGLAVLQTAGHRAPVNSIAVMSGIGGALGAVVGAVSSCLSGPGNALLTSSGEPARQYTGALTYGVCVILFGLLAPTFTGLMLAAPQAFIMALAGLAMLRVLQAAFIGSFSTGGFTLGALISMLVTVADIGIFNIGAAFWGLVAGFVVSWLLERRDFSSLARPA